MKYQLKATKTSLYALCKRYWPDIAPLKQATFTKAFRCRSYWLEFNSLSMYHRVFFSVCAGDAVVGDAWEMEDENGKITKGWETHKIGLDELRSFGLLEEIPDKKEGK